MAISVISRSSAQAALGEAVSVLLGAHPDLTALALPAPEGGARVAGARSVDAAGLSAALAGIVAAGGRPLVVGDLAALAAALGSVSAGAALVVALAPPRPSAPDDQALDRALPGAVWAQPADARELPAVLAAVAAQPGPAVVRVPAGEPVRVHGDDAPFVPGRSTVLLQGQDVTLAATGVAVGEALLAALELQAEGTSSRVINVSSLHPLDAELLGRCAGETDGLVTIDELAGPTGLGARVAAALPGATLAHVCLAPAGAEDDAAVDAADGLTPAARRIRAAVTAFVRTRRR